MKLKREKPVARPGPVEEKSQKTTILGALRGQAWETGDIVSPLPPASAWGTKKPQRRRR